MYLFTSEAVSAGHPDKVADIIADSIVDDILKNDSNARIASEVFIAGKNVVIGGEVSTKYKCNYKNIVKKAIENIGYNKEYRKYWKEDESFIADDVNIQVFINEQSPEIAQGVNKDEEIGAGDQGIMFGYADIETEDFMPSAITYARKIVQYLYQYSKSHPMNIGLDIKSQVTMDYETKENFENSKPQRVHTVVVSVPSKLPYENLKNFVIQRVSEIIPIDEDTIFHINPTGAYVKHSPLYDSGLTGRKLIVDSFGGYAPIGGGAQSSKDYTKVDRSGLYAARYIAKKFVKEGNCTKCLVQISYAIGESKPISVVVDTYGTGDDEYLTVLANKYPLTPKWIKETFSLDKPGIDFSYADVAARGQVGFPDYPWEKV